MNNQERTVSFDARLEGRGMTLPQPLASEEEPGPAEALSLGEVHRLPADSARTQPADLRQNTSGEQKLDGMITAAPDGEDAEALHLRASPYNLRWGIRN